MSLSGGPIVEQATHFVDLMRFFAGEILEDTVKAVAVGPQQKLVDMPAAPEGEHEVIFSQQLPHIWHTTAMQLPCNCSAAVCAAYCPWATACKRDDVLPELPAEACVLTLHEKHVLPRLAQGSNCMYNCTCRHIRWSHSSFLCAYPEGHTAGITA